MSDEKDLTKLGRLIADVTAQTVMLSKVIEMAVQRVQILDRIIEQHTKESE